MQKIIPNLWFAHNAEEAVQFYTGAFNKGRVISTARYPAAGNEIHGMKPGTVMTVEFEIEGYAMLALNGGPAFEFTPAISFMVNCPTVEEVNELYGRLFEGGSALMPLDTYPFSERYGWVKDKYGVTWQIIDKAGKAREAIELYTSVFPHSHTGTLVEYGEGNASEPKENLMYGEFTLAGQSFSAMDSSMKEHQFTFNEAISLIVACKDQSEIDHYFEKLSAVPEAEMCGWVKDPFGVSWQIVPEGMNEIMNDADPEKRERAMAARMKMKKLDMEELKSA